MAYFLIEYNPYQNVTNVSKNGKVESKNARLSSYMNRERLQNWFNEADGWPGLGAVIEDENNDESCTIAFRGRSIDYDDLQDYFDNSYTSQHDTRIMLNHIAAKNDADILRDIEALVDQVEETQLLEGNQIEQLRQEYSRLRHDPFVISVIATMSSGKSTLLNALLRKDFLPTGDKATTATIVEIEDDDNAKDFTAECFDGKGHMIVPKKIVNSNDIKELNENENIHTIKVIGDIPGISSSKIALKLRDTPGPNNSQDERHGQLTDSIIMNGKNMSVVLYVMNATNLEVTSDKELLETIAKEMKRGGKQAKDRFLFVINKVDDWIKSDNEAQTLKLLIEGTKKYLKTFGIDNPNLFPVNALLAKRIWMSREGYEFGKRVRFDQDVTDFSDPDDNEAHFERVATLSPSSRKIINMKLVQAIESNDIKTIALMHSGVPALEQAISEYLEKYAYPMKIAEAIEEFKDIIDEKKMRNSFTELLKYDEEALENVTNQIDTIQHKKDERVHKRKEFEKEIDNYSLDSQLKVDAIKNANQRFKIVQNKELSNLGEKIEVAKSKAAIASFAKAVKALEIELDKELKEKIEGEVYAKGKKLIEDYSKYMGELKRSINVQGFDINKIASLKKYNFKDIESVSQKIAYSEEVYRSEKVQKTIVNPNKRWWNFWRSEYISTTVTEQVKTGEIQYVDFTKVQDEIVELSIQTIKNIDGVFEECNKQLEIFKNKFKAELGKLDEVIEIIIADLIEMTRQKKDIDSRKQYNIEQIQKLDDIVAELNSATNI